MELEFHVLDLKYEPIKGRNRKMEKRLLASLIDQGQLSPIIVLGGKGDPPKYVVMDGFKRIRALKRSGQDTVKAVVWPEDEVSALIAINHLQRTVDRMALEDAYLIKVLRDYHGLSYEEIGRRLGRSKSWVGRRLGLLTVLPVWLQDQIRTGVLQCYAAERYILPLARANPKDAQDLVKNIRPLNLSTRDIGELYAAWRDNGASGRELIVCSPHVFLRARCLTKKDIEEKGSKSRVFKDMEIILSLSHRIRRSLNCRLISSLNRTDIKHMNQSWEAVQDRIAELDMKLKAEVFGDERRGNASSDSQIA